MSNLKQIGLSLVMYSQDNDERLFARNTNWANFTSNSSTTTTADKTWLEPYQPYIKSLDVLRCPSHPARDNNNRRSMDYNVNSIVLFSTGTTNAAFRDISVPMHLFDNTRTMIAMDGRGTDMWSDTYYTYSQISADGSRWETCTYYCVGMRHLDGFNAGFLDGHAKWIPRTKVYLKYDGTPVLQISRQFRNPEQWRIDEPGLRNAVSPSLWYTAP